MKKAKRSARKENLDKRKPPRIYRVGFLNIFNNRRNKLLKPMLLFKALLPRALQSLQYDSGLETIFQILENSNSRILNHHSRNSLV
jgi:hypothetical protein